jgi:ribonuclease HI
MGVKVAIASIYADGGLLSSNPSSDGGTFAFVLVDEEGNAIEHTSGIVRPEHAGLAAITNNYTELLAVTQAMLYVPERWDGMIYTDSYVTVCRLTAKVPKMNGIPHGLQEKFAEARARLGAFCVTLLDGHPTRKQLESGIGKRGNPVSKWNKLCDDLCNQQAAMFWEKVGIQA